MSWLSTGFPELDTALGGGLPEGCLVEVFGPEASGKTTLMLKVIAHVQAEGKVAAFVDAEHALDLSYARKLGVDFSRLLVLQPDSGEQALEITDELVWSGAVDIAVIGSVAALVPRVDHVGLQARLMSQALRKLASTAARSGTTVVFINLLAELVDGLSGLPFGTTAGGNALKLYSSVRMRLARVGGNRTLVKVVKNKLAPPFHEAELDL